MSGKLMRGGCYLSNAHHVERLSRESLESMVNTIVSSRSDIHLGNEETHSARA